MSELSTIHQPPARASRIAIITVDQCEVGRVFDGYSEKARRAMFFSRYEAGRFDSSMVETEHLLLGIMREDKALMVRLISPPELMESIHVQIETRTPFQHEVAIVSPIAAETLTDRAPGSPVSFESVRRLIEANPAIHEQMAMSANLPFSDECKRVMDAAEDEANRLNHERISTEHLLLGLLREDKCFAAELLKARSVELDVVREDLLNRLQ
jgi:ATP-dependent Clp protease ATP-binding subunit ClpC